MNELILFLNQMHDTHVAPGLCPLDLCTVAQRPVLERLVLQLVKMSKASSKEL